MGGRGEGVKEGRKGWMEEREEGVKEGGKREEKEGRREGVE